MMGALGLIATLVVGLLLAGLMTAGVAVVTLGLCAAWMMFVGVLSGDWEKPK
jgi:hypothetical protein